PRYSHREPTVGNRRTKDRHLRFVSRSEHAIFRRDLSKFSTNKMQELARRVSPRLIELFDEVTDPLFCFAIFFVTREQIPHATDLRRLQLRVRHAGVGLKVIAPECFV